MILAWASPFNAVCLESRDRGFVHRSGIQISKKKVFLPRSLVKIQYCGESPWPTGSVFDLTSPGLEFRILCVVSSVISFISRSSGGYPGSV